MSALCFGKLEKLLALPVLSLSLYGFRLFLGDIFNSTTVQFNASLRQTSYPSSGKVMESETTAREKKKKNFSIKIVKSTHCRKGITKFPHFLFAPPYFALVLSLHGLKPVKSNFHSI